MMEDYYSPHPRVLLSRPLVLVGHPAAGVEQVGRGICGRTGLPFNHVERGAEALAGASRARILLDTGLEQLRDLETRALAKSVRRRPCGVIVMESGLFENADLVAWLAERSTLLYLRRPDAVLLDLIRRHLARSAGGLPDFPTGPPDGPESLRELLAPRERGLASIERIVEAGDAHPGRLVGPIMGSLDRLMSVEHVPA